MRWALRLERFFDGVYLTVPSWRATVHGATTKSESFNAFVQWLAFGGMGVLRTNNREELRKRIKYNHLVANCVVLYKRL